MRMKPSPKRSRDANPLLESIAIVAMILLDYLLILWFEPLFAALIAGAVVTLMVCLIYLPKRPLSLKRFVLAIFLAGVFSYATQKLMK